LFETFKSEDGQSMAYVFALLDPVTAVARFFFPQGQSVLEDPATGSATAGLGGWWLAMGRALPCRLEIAQGEQAARPSTLYLQVHEAGTIAVGGDVIELGRGSAVPPVPGACMVSRATCCEPVRTLSMPCAVRKD
jgi:predicted PhzF superfamily epimerase YddE/YHI9